VKHEYLMIFIVRKDGRSTIMKRNLGYGFYPPRIWPKGKIIKEYYAFILPKWGEGQYSVIAGVLDDANIEMLDAKVVDEASLIKKIKKQENILL